MKQKQFIWIFFTALIIIAQTGLCQDAVLLLKDVTLIDGNGGVPREHTDILIRDGKIVSIGQGLNSPRARVINLTGKTIMPAMTGAHVHVGVIKGNQGSGTFFTRENILAQLKKYQDYGITNILTMGTDRPLLFEKGIRDSSLRGLLPGARFHSAGYGFNVPDPSVTRDAFLGNLYRPASAVEVPAMMSELVKLKPELIKIWVDGSPANKMKPEIYRTIINEAHNNTIRVAAHVYYLADARALIASGIDVFAHSIRDSLVDEALIEQIRKRNIPYIPTLTLDKFASAYTSRPGWMDDSFFRKALEPGVYEMLDSEQYRESQRKSPAVSRSADAHQIALKNVKRLHDAGVLIALGTDSGAFPFRPQGFAEHLELELLVQAGLSPLEAITVATRNAAQVLRIDNEFGTIEPGKSADLVVLSASPAYDIKNTRLIEAVYKAGIAVSKGPLVN